MTQTFVIFGRQPKIGLAELEALYGAESIQPIGHVGALLNIEPDKIDFSKLGGTVKFGKLLTILDTTKWKDIEEFLVSAIPSHASGLEPGKLRLGISAYELHVAPKDIMVTGLRVKKALKASGRSARLIPNNMPMLNSAQVLHNQLTGKLGWELLFVRHGDKTYVGQSIAVQDIDAYAARDHGRPKRDARVGMLPPKLAQIIINFANPHENAVVLDPFCGTGVVLQESMLMGFKAYGTDIEPRMIAYSQANLDWLMGTRQFLHVCGPDNSRQNSFRLGQADATNAEWVKFDAIACETYLGQPFSAFPAPEKLNKVIQDVNTIHIKFLKNVAKQTESGQKLSLAVPAWINKYEIKHLPVLDHLEELGYTRSVFKNASKEDLIYHRDGQIVGRELVLLTRK